MKYLLQVGFQNLKLVEISYGKDQRGALFIGAVIKHAKSHVGRQITIPHDGSYFDNLFASGLNAETKDHKL